jgi:hypothetical protein
MLLDKIEHRSFFHVLQYKILNIVNILVYISIIKKLNSRNVKVKVW